MQTIITNEGSVRALVVSSEGWLFSGSGEGDCAIRVWTTDGSHMQTLTGHKSSVEALVVSPDGRLFSGSWEDGAIRVW